MMCKRECIIAGNITLTKEGMGSNSQVMGIGLRQEHGYAIHVIEGKIELIGVRFCCEGNQFSFDSF